MIKTLFKIIGWLFLASVVFFIKFRSLQIDGIKSICKTYREGVEIVNPAQVAKKYSVEYLGSFGIKNNPGAKSAKFCATLTICDTSCVVDYKNNIVIKSRYSDF